MLKEIAHLIFTHIMPANASLRFAFSECIREVYEIISPEFYKRSSCGWESPTDRKQSHFRSDMPIL